MESSITALAVSNIIEIALAPVFLLTGIAAMLSMMTLRLARVVDRWRYLDSRAQGLPEEDRESVLHEAKIVWRRVQLVTWAIRFAVASALLVCLNICLLFLGDFKSEWVGGGVAYMFVASMIILILSLGVMLAEVSISTSTMKQKLEHRLLKSDKDDSNP